MLDDALLDTFHNIFANEVRGPFPLQQVQQYTSTLKTCTFCSETYPDSRPRCPHCSNATSMPVLPPTQGRLIVRTQGAIVAWHIGSDAAQWIAHENGKAVLYTLNGLGITRTLPLFETLPRAAYAFMDEHVVVAPTPDSVDLYGININGHSRRHAAHYNGRCMGARMSVFLARAGQRCIGWQMAT
ncbi:hypothetical protein HC776_02990 [bacterium]|nr:hypothetical protein [bacterium]